MKRNVITFFAGIALVAPALAVAQVPASCVGPGAAFGVTAYTCASCGLKLVDGRTIYSFNAEPVITEVLPWSVLKPGDIVEAVGGSPITTAAGADAFANPLERRVRSAADTLLLRLTEAGVRLRVRGRGGDTLRSDSLRLPVLRLADSSLRARRSGFMAIRVRRDGQSMMLLGEFGVRCAGGRRDWTLYGTGVDSLRGGRRNWIRPDSVVDEAVNVPESPGKFGFAVACTPSCTRTRSADGTEYWRYDGLPTIALVRDGSPAARTGLRAGDVVTKVDGLSILEEKAALRLLRAERTASLHLTVRRGDREVDYLLSTP